MISPYTEECFGSVSSCHDSLWLPYQCLSASLHPSLAKSPLLWGLQDPPQGPGCLPALGSNSLSPSSHGAWSPGRTQDSPIHHFEALPLSRGPQSLRPGCQEMLHEVVLPGEYQGPLCSGVWLPQSSLRVLPLTPARTWALSSPHLRPS